MRVNAPDDMVLHAGLTARDALLLAVKSNLSILTEAVRASLEPGDVTFNLSLTLHLQWTPADALAVLREAGYEINIPPKGELQ